MIKRTISAALGLLCVCLPVVAQDDVETFTRDQLQQTGEINTGPALALHRPDLFSSVDGTVLIHGLPVLALLDGRRILVSSEMGRMGMAPLDIFPAAFFSAVEVQTGSNPRYGSDGTGGVVNLSLNRPMVGHGEVGVFYGGSSGKFGHTDFQSYMIGTVGNDKVQFTAGAAYEHSSGHSPRFQY